MRGGIGGGGAVPALSYFKLRRHNGNNTQMVPYDVSVVHKLKIGKILRLYRS